MTQLALIGQPEYGDILLPKLGRLQDHEELAMHREIIKLQDAHITTEDFTIFLATLAMQRIDPTWDTPRTARLSPLLVINLANFMFTEARGVIPSLQLSNKAADLDGNFRDSGISHPP